MDYARKIGKTEKQRKWEPRRQPLVTVSDFFMSKDKPTSEDHRLKNWRKWLNDRQKQYRHVKQATGRHQTEQLSNSCERIRRVIEKKILMEYANLPVPVAGDKYRGGPEFWRTPEVLSKHANSVLPDISVTPSRKDLNLCPEVEFVALPEMIEKEKDLAGIGLKKGCWERSEYLKTRKKELTEEIRVLAPKEPEMEEIQVQGRSFKETEKLLRIPPITITEAEEVVEDHDRAVILKILDREIVREKSMEKANSDPMIWSFTFSIDINKIAEKEITFENKGTIVVVYQWRQELFQSNLMSFERRTSPFFFNKTKGLVLPGQIANLKVWYKPKEPGVSTESWRLVTEPILSASSLIFRFWGCAGGEQEISKVSRSIDGYLGNRVRDMTVREVMEEILGNIDHSRPPEPAYGSLFRESEIFRSKNPFHFYAPTSTVELKRIYYKVKGHSAPLWSLELQDLKEILLGVENPIERNDMLEKFHGLCRECSVPTVYTSVENNKYETVYSLICSFFNVFERESEFVRNTCVAREDRTSLEKETAKSVSNTSVKSNNSRKRGRKSSNRSQSNQSYEIELKSLSRTSPVYKEIFFIRVYMILLDTIDRISAAVDSLNSLYEPDK